MNRLNMFGLVISRIKQITTVAAIFLMSLGWCATSLANNYHKMPLDLKNGRAAIKMAAAPAYTPAPVPTHVDNKLEARPAATTDAAANPLQSAPDKEAVQVPVGPSEISDTQLVGSNGVPPAFGPTAMSCGGPVSGFSLPTPPGIALGRKTVVLTFEGGPDTSTTAIAEYLASKGVKATFFMSGCRFEGRRNLGVCTPGSPKYPVSYLKYLTAVGHRVANFSEYQSNLMALPLPQALEELRLTQQLFDPFIADGLYLFKTAGNCWNGELAKAARADPYLRKLTGPFGVDGYGSNLDCLKRKLSAADCAKEYIKALPPNKSGILRLHERSSGKLGGGKYLFDLTKCLVGGLGPSSSCPRPLLKDFKIVPLDAIAGIKSQVAFKTPVVWGSAYGDTADGGAWRTNQSYYGSIRLGHVTGDNLVDVCGRGPSGVQCALSTENGLLAPPTSWLTALSDSSGVLQTPYSTTMQLADIDGDGKADLCIRQIKGLFCYRSNGKNGFSKNPIWTTPFFADKKGWIKPEAYESIRIADINGDGFADACGQLSDGIYCAIGNRQDLCPKNYTGFCPEGSLWNGYFSSSRNFYKNTHMMLGDINGDKRADLCVWKEGAVYCAPSDGTKFGKVSVWSMDFSERNGFSTAGYYYKSLQLVDINGDGKKDICGYNGTGVVCALSNGSNAFTNFQYINNSDFLESTGWAQPEYGSTLMMIDGNSYHKAAACFRGVWGITCATAP